MLKNSKSQMWFTDFVIGTLIFTFMLIAFFTYASNISKQDITSADDLLSDAETVSSSILLSGFPDDWDNSTVLSIGITNNNQRVNKTKINNFKKVQYNSSKKVFGTIYDYFIFFEDQNGSAVNVEGICGIGEPAVDINFSIKSAYYQSKTGDSLLKDFMQNTIKADLYKEDESGIDLPDLIAALNDYKLVVLEHPSLDGGEFNSYKDDFESYVSPGNFLFISGMVATPSTNEMLGVEFHKHAGESITNLNATVFEKDKFLAFEVNQNITFAQAYYTVNDSVASVNFTKIAKFSENDISEPLNDAVSRWDYGDGKVFFFSDFDAKYFSEDFIDLVGNSILMWTNPKCIIGLNSLKYKNFVRVERILIYNSNPIKMVLYLWQ